jgi:hypothetical protein
MAVTYANTLKNTRMQAVISAVDAAAGFGSMEIGTAAFAATLVSVILVKPSFTVGAQLITMNGVPLTGVAAASGTAAAARIKDGNGNIIVSGLTVGTTAADVIINNAAVTSGATVTITSGTITHS